MIRWIKRWIAIAKTQWVLDRERAKTGGSQYFEVIECELEEWSDTGVRGHTLRGFMRQHGVKYEDTTN